MFSTEQYKKAHKARFSIAGYACSTQTKVLSHPAIYTKNKIKMKVKYINDYKAVFDFKHMGLFLVCQGMWALGGLSDMIS